MGPAETGEGGLNDFAGRWQRDRHPIRPAEPGGWTRRLEKAAGA